MVKMTATQLKKNLCLLRCIETDRKQAAQIIKEITESYDALAKQARALAKLVQANTKEAIRHVAGYAASNEQVQKLAEQGPKYRLAQTVLDATEEW